MSSFDVRGLDTYTNKMMTRLTKEYPQKTKSFLTQQINGCKGDVVSRTPRSTKKSKKHARAKHLQDNWKTTVKVKNGKSSAVLKNASPHAHLIENGHLTENGGYVEGVHMLEKTMATRQPKIDRAIDSFIDNMFDF